MIMGAGKTTVISPVLTLMLADGERLVVLVTPKALLQFSKTVSESGGHGYGGGADVFVSVCVCCVCVEGGGME